jgi:(p)ppGpp synthase/HD superfamily hydrolase
MSMKKKPKSTAKSATTRTTHIWQSAALFAACAHRHDLRKDGVTPYIAHPMRVALTIACVFGFNDDAHQPVLAAALLHDTIEDGGTDYDDILEQFGRKVADLVAVMTKDARLEESRREKAYDAQLAAGPWQGRLIKLADVYDNLLSAEDAASRRRQLSKAKRILKLTAGDRPLHQARARLADVVKGLGRGR